jgi:hypothetical protein
MRVNFIHIFIIAFEFCGLNFIDIYLPQIEITGKVIFIKVFKQISECLLKNNFSLK